MLGIKSINQRFLREIIKEQSCPFVLYVGKKQLIKRKLFEQYINKIREI